MAKTKKGWDLLFEDLKIIKTTYKKFGVRWCLCWGSLLGAIREGDFISGSDDDIDLMILPPTTTELYYETMESFEKKGGFFPYQVKSNPSKMRKRNIGVVEIVRIGPSKNGHPDYYYFKHFPMHKRFFEELKTAKIRDLECPIPNYAEEFLEICYGDTWKIKNLKLHLPHATFLRRLLAKKAQGL